MRDYIVDCGGEIHFNKKIDRLVRKRDKITEVQTADGDTCTADAFILATGHSARDIFQLFHEKKKKIQAKAFCPGCARGTSAGTHQFDSISLYPEQGPRVTGLPPAAYQLVHTENRPVSFFLLHVPGWHHCTGIHE